MPKELTAKGKATRNRIVEGAAVVLREKGVSAATLDDVMARTHASKSQLFHYFPDGKSDLLLAVAEYEAEQILADQQPMTVLETWQLLRKAGGDSRDLRRSFRSRQCWERARLTSADSPIPFAWGGAAWPD